MPHTNINVRQHHGYRHTHMRKVKLQSAKEADNYWDATHVDIELVNPWHVDGNDKKKYIISLFYFILLTKLSITLA